MTAVGMTAGALANAATLHVSSAAGGEGDGSAEAPYRSLASAMTMASEGDTIVLQKGIHRIENGVTVDKPNLTILSLSGERAVLVGGEDIPYVLSIVSSGVTLHNVAIQGGFYGVKIDVEDEQPTRNVSIMNCQIGQTGADCIKSFNADNLRIEYCVLGPSGLEQEDNAEGIDVIGSHRVTVRGCVIQDIATNGVYFKGGTRDGVVEKCLIRNTGHSGILLGQDTDHEYMRDNAKFEAIDCIARNNVVIGARAAGVGTYSGKNISFVHNTLLDVAKEVQAGVWIVTNGREIPAEGVRVYGNIISLGGERPAMFIKDAVGLPKSDSNVFYSRRGAIRIVREISADDSLNRDWDFESWRKSARMDTQSKVGEAKLDSRYRPLHGSPAIGISEAAVQDDYFGQKRSAKSTEAGAVCASPLQANASSATK